MGVAERLRAVMDELAAHAIMAGRQPSDVKLVTVTKTHPASAVVEAFDAGATVVGENRVQEAIAKQDELADWTAMNGGPDWHLIGSLQKNKARHAAGRFALIHSLDSLELAAELDKRARAAGIVQDVLVEVNIAGEASKHGVAPEDAPGLVYAASKLTGIRVTGLMCVPPFTDDPEDSRPHFRSLRELMERINASGHNLRELSMGMTQDYGVAVEEGATLVRVGTAIFGERECKI